RTSWRKMAVSTSFAPWCVRIPKESIRTELIGEAIHLHPQASGGGYGTAANEGPAPGWVRDIRRRGVGRAAGGKAEPADRPVRRPAAGGSGPTAWDHAVPAP